MNADGILSQFPFQLSDGFQKRRTFNVADGSANFRNNKIIVVFFAQQLDASLDFVRNVWHHLYGLAQVVAVSFLVDDGFIDAARGQRVGPSRLYAGETLVVAQVQIGLHAVHGHVAFAVLVRVQRAWVDVDVGVHLLDGDVVAPCLQQLANARRDDALAQRRDHASRNEYVFSICH